MEHVLKHTKTYRYETLHADNAPVIVLYALHGYGQLAKFFIKKLTSVDERILIVAPEGMHRFYLKGASGRVGASWMTKEARETDIEDNIAWLNALDDKISTQHSISKRILLGFSQGGATAIRWKLSAVHPFDQTIIWASDFPPDMEYTIDQLKDDKENYFLIGTKDEFYEDNRREQLLSFYRNVNFEAISYVGSHDIDAAILNNLLNNTLLKN